MNKSDRDVYNDLKEHFEKVFYVEVASGNGAQGIKFKKKIFAMFNEDLLLQFSPGRLQELIAQGNALPFDPGTGKPKIWGSDRPGAR